MRKLSLFILMFLLLFQSASNCFADEAAETPAAETSQSDDTFEPADGTDETSGTAAVSASGSEKEQSIEKEHLKVTPINDNSETGKTEEHHPEWKGWAGWVADKVQGRIDGNLKDVQDGGSPLLNALDSTACELVKEPFSKIDKMQQSAVRAGSDLAAGKDFRTQLSNHYELAKDAIDAGTSVTPSRRSASAAVNGSKSLYQSIKSGQGIKGIFKSNISGRPNISLASFAEDSDEATNTIRKIKAKDRRLLDKNRTMIEKSNKPPRQRGFRGGKQNQRDSMGGFESDEAFERWWHRQGKEDYGGSDMDPAEAPSIYRQWVLNGKPTPK